MSGSKERDVVSSETRGHYYSGRATSGKSHFISRAQTLLRFKRPFRTQLHRSKKQNEGRKEKVASV